MENTAATPTPSPPVPLAVLALELGTTVEDLEGELGTQNVFTHGGFRSCTAFMASEILKAHAARQAKAEADARRESEAARERRQRARARAIAARQDTSPRVEKLGVQMLTVRPDGPEGVTAAAHMVAKANDVDFGDGTPSTRRPSKMDWLTNQNLEGGTFGPEPRRGKVHSLKKKGAGK